MRGPRSNATISNSSGPCIRRAWEAADIPAASPPMTTIRRRCSVGVVLPPVSSHERPCLVQRGASTKRLGLVGPHEADVVARVPADLRALPVLPEPAGLFGRCQAVTHAGVDGPGRGGPRSPPWPAGTPPAGPTRAVPSSTRCSMARMWTWRGEWCRNMSTKSTTGIPARARSSSDSNAAVSAVMYPPRDTPITPTAVGVLGPDPREQAPDVPQAWDSPWTACMRSKLTGTARR